MPIPMADPNGLDALFRFPAPVEVEVDEAALAWAREIATLAPLTLAHNKLVLTRMVDTAQDDDIEASFAACWASDDVREAALARTEKRTPVFHGR